MKAQNMTKVLGGHWHGSYGTARCPAHGDHEPSLSLRAGGDGEPVFNCFAGCDWRDIKDVLRARGLLPERGNGRAAPALRRRTPGVPKSQPVEVDVDQQQRMEFACRKWHEAVPLMGSPADGYLRERALEPGPDGWPPSLRYHPALKHGPTGLVFRAMVAAVTHWPSRDVTAVHRTFLKVGGNGKAPVSTPKMAIGAIGAGAVRLASAQPALGIAEGIETALSAMQLFEIPVWAALGSRMDRVTLPEQVVEIHIFGDNGGPGHEAAEKAAHVFTRQGRRVALRFPPLEYGDWNDALQAKEPV